MNRWVSLFAVPLILTWVGVSAAGAQTEGQAQQLYGVWYSYPPGNPNTDAVRREFRHNSATGKDELIVTRLCPGDRQTVSAQAISPIEIAQDTIRILKSASKSEAAQGNSMCQVSIEAGNWSYTISEEGNRVTLTHPGGNPDILELARQGAESEAGLPANLYGTWLFPWRDENGMRIQVRFVFYSTAESARGKLRKIATCSKGNSSLISAVDSDVSVSRDQITIPESTTHEERDGPLICRVTISAGTMRYAVAPNGATMTLSGAGGAPMKLIREGKPGSD